MAVESYKYAVKIINALNYLCALRNFTDLKENKWKFAFTWFYNILLVSSFVFSIGICEWYSLFSFPYNIERIVYTFLAIVYMIGFSCIVSLGLHHSKDVLVLMKQIDTVDANLKKLEPKVEYDSLYRHVLLMGSIWLVIFIVLTGMYTEFLIRSIPSWYNVGVNILYLYGTNVSSIVLYDFKIGVYWLGLRFKETNELLRTFLVEGQQIKMENPPVENPTTQPSRNSRNQFKLDRWLSEYPIHRARVFPINNVLKQETQSVKKVHLLQQIRFAHLQLCCASKMLNKIFDFQLLTYAAVLLIYITVILYYIYMEFQRQSGSIYDVNNTLVFIVDAFASCFKIALVSYSCERTANEATRTIEIIHSCSVYEIDTDLKDEILQFSLQISHTQLGRSKSAFFRLNYGFIRDCMSFVTTYLVIIIQWSQNLQDDDPLIIRTKPTPTALSNLIELLGRGDHTGDKTVKHQTLSSFLPVMYEPKTIVQTIRPILAMNFICGLGVFEFWRNKPHKILEYTYTVCCLVLLNLINQYSVHYFKGYFVSSTFELSQSMFKTIFYFNEIVISILIIFSRLNAKKMKAVIELIEGCDQTMENMGMPKQYNKLLLNQITYFLVYGVSIFVFSVAIYNWHFKPDTPILIKLLLTFLAHVPLILTSVCEISFSFWVNTYLQMKFRQLNELLRSMLIAVPDTPQNKEILGSKYDYENKSFKSFRNDQTRGSNGNAKTMRAVKQLHLELIKIARTINSTYGMQILLLMITSFIFTTGLLYLTYRLMWLNLTTNEFLHEIMTTMCWIIAYSTKIFSMNHACAKTSTEAANAGDIICELYEPTTSKDFRAEIRDFTLQLIQNPLVFTACGFFDMDHAFIQGVVGSITTYLVILIQVGDMTKVQLARSLSNKIANVTQEPESNQQF